MNTITNDATGTPIEAAATTGRKPAAAKRAASARKAPARAAAAKAAPDRATKPARPAAAAKSTVSAKPAPGKTAKARKPDRPVVHKPRAKLVRDSFTMPQVDFDLIAAMKARALKFGRPTKKSELLRAGLQVLAALNDAQLSAALAALPPLKPGRPKKD
jgi:hypothetical protein